jgi:hypothetical protein
MLPRIFVDFLEQIWCYQNYYIITMGCKTKYMNFGHTSVTVDILFKYWMSKYELFIFLWFLGAVLWALIFLGGTFHSKENSGWPMRQRQ